MLDILSSWVLLVLGDLSDGVTPPDARGVHANPITLLFQIHLKNVTNIAGYVYCRRKV